jgi:hypothetical protein
MTKIIGVTQGLKLLVAGGAIVSVAACVTNTTYRTARAPHPSVPFANGGKQTTPVEFSGGLSSVADPVKPTLGDESQGVEVPKSQVRGEVRFRVNDRVFAGVVGEAGLGRQRVADDLPEVADKTVVGLGALLGGSVRLSPTMRLGWVTELMSWQVPYVEYSVTSVGGVPVFSTLDRGTDNVLTLGVGLTPSYNDGPMTIFGGVFARNHPTVDRVDIDIVGGGNTGDPEVRSGPFNALVNVGFSYDFSSQISGTAILHQNVVQDPVEYGPGLQLALTAKLGR